MQNTSLISKTGKGFFILFRFDFQDKKHTFEVLKN